MYQNFKSSVRSCRNLRLKLKIAIYGAGALGRELYYLLIGQNYKNGQIIFIDDSGPEDQISSATGNRITFQEFVELGTQTPIVIAQGDPQKRKLIAHRLNSAQQNLATIIDKTAIIRGQVKLGQGSIVSALSIISDGSMLAENVFINSNSVIGHDVTIGENSSISSQVNIGGESKLGENVFVGSGAKIRDGIVIGSNAVIAAGSVVFDDIRPDVVALGNPAKPIANNLGRSPFK